ncbi:MAG: SGNH/GDSL hydrolase family protein [Anaerolineae bacterium]|nr:SGNH/GDSL hydrolase family protein [Anaerolineae bacterium]
MTVPDVYTYLADLVERLNVRWPDNETVNIVCHGHSVPAGYMASPLVDTFNAYPHLLHRGLKARFPYAVVNVIVTAIGGENSVSGAARFARDVLTHRPDVVTIDYGLNDRGLGLVRAEKAWRTMTQAALDAGVKVILMTPTPDLTQRHGYEGEDQGDLLVQAAQIRELAGDYGVGLVDSLAAFEAYVAAGTDLTDLLSWVNHPNRQGHELVARALLRWFAVR